MPLFVAYDAAEERVVDTNSRVQSGMREHGCAA